MSSENEDALQHIPPVTRILTSEHQKYFPTVYVDTVFSLIITCFCQSIAIFQNISTNPSPPHSANSKQPKKRATRTRARTRSDLFLLNLPILRLPGVGAGPPFRDGGCGGLSERQQPSTNGLFHLL